MDDNHPPLRYFFKPSIMRLLHITPSKRAKRVVVLLSLSLSLLPASALAGWERLAYSEASGSTQYIDPATLKTLGKTRRVWLLHDYTKPINGDLSYTALMEYDCEGERSRGLQASYYSGNMGTGTPRGGWSTPTEWRYAAPGTLGARQMTVICSAAVPQ